MGRLIVSANMTVDCVMDPMEGWFDPTLGGGDGIAQLRAADELILGRKTYEKLAEYWPKSNPYPGAEHPACSSGGDQAELTMDVVAVIMGTLFLLIFAVIIAHTR
jgi:dihydrofolate reductase